MNGGCLDGDDVVYLISKSHDIECGGDVDVNTLHTKAYGGNEAAERELFRKLSDRFRHFAEWKIGSKPDAEEVAQEALMVVTRKYKGIDPGGNFTAWAHKVLELEILKFHRTRGTRERKQEELSARDDRNLSGHQMVELKRKLLECLVKVGRVNIIYARVLNLQYQGFSSDEICHKLELRKSYSYVLLSRARHMLKTCLTGGDIQ